MNHSDNIFTIEENRWMEVWLDRFQAAASLDSDQRAQLRDTVLATASLYGDRISPVRVVRSLGVVAGLWQPLRMGVDPVPWYSDIDGDDPLLTG